MSFDLIMRAHLFGDLVVPSTMASAMNFHHHQWTAIQANNRQIATQTIHLIVSATIFRIEHFPIANLRLRIPMKSATYSNLKPATIPI